MVGPDIRNRLYAQAHKRLYLLTPAFIAMTGELAFARAPWQVTPCL